MRKDIISKISSISKVGLFASCIKNISAMNITTLDTNTLDISTYNISKLDKNSIKFVYSNKQDEYYSLDFNFNLLKMLYDPNLTYEKLIEKLNCLDHFYFYNISNSKIIVNDKREANIKLATINIKKIENIINDLSSNRQNEINTDLKTIKENCFDYLYNNYFNKDKDLQPKDILKNIIKYHRGENYTTDFKEKSSDYTYCIVKNLYNRMSKYFKDEGIYRFINKFCYLYFNNIVDKISNNPENRLILPTIKMYDDNKYSTKTCYETGKLLNKKGQYFHNLRKGTHKTDLDDDCVICCIKNLLTNSEREMYKNILNWQTKNSFSDSSCYLKLYFDNLLKDKYKTQNRNLTNNFKEEINDIKENIWFLNLKYDKVIFTETIDFMWALTYVILTYGKIDTSDKINEKTNLYRVFYLEKDKIMDTISKRDNLNDIFSSTSIGGPYYRFNGFSKDIHPVGYKVCAENFLCIYNYIFSFDSNSYMIDSELEIGYLFLDKLKLITLDDIEFPYDIEKKEIQDILSKIEKNYNDTYEQNLYKNIFLTNAFCNINTFNNEMNNILKNKLFEKNGTELNLDIKYFNSGKQEFIKEYIRRNVFEALYSKEEEKNKMLEFLNKNRYFKKNSNRISKSYDDIKKIYDFENYKSEVDNFLGEKIDYDKFLRIKDFTDYIEDVIKKLSLKEILEEIKKKESKIIKKDRSSNEFFKRIFEIKENNVLRPLKTNELCELVERYSDFLFKKKLNIKNIKTDIEGLLKKYNLNEKQKYSLETYKKFLSNGFLEKYLDLIVSKKNSHHCLYSDLIDKFLNCNFLNFENLDLSDVNLYLFPSAIYQDFYDKYLNKSAEILYERYLKKIKNFKLKDLQEYSEFEKNKKKEVLENLNYYLKGVKDKNKKFDIFNEYLGKEYLFKNLITKDNYNNYKNLENKREKDVKKFCNDILLLEKHIIDDYKNELLLIGNIIDLFFNKELNKLSAEQRIDKLSQEGEYKDFLKSLINEEKGEKINKLYSFSEFINKLSRKINSINDDLKTINTNNYENFEELEESCNEVKCEIQKIKEKLNECNTKFYGSQYFINLLETYSKKIEFLEELYKKFLEKEDGKELYHKYCIHNKEIDIDKNLLDEILKKSEAEENDKKNDLKTLHNYIKKSLEDINLEGYENFKKFTDFNEKINGFIITTSKEEENKLMEMQEEEEKEEDYFEQHEYNDDSYCDRYNNSDDDNNNNSYDDNLY